VNIRAHHAFLVTLIKSVMNGNRVAQSLFESAEFRAAITHLAEKYSAEAREMLDGPEVRDERGATDLGPRDLLHMIVAGTPAAKRSIADIRIWLKGSEQIAICDPCIMHPKKSALFSSDDDYINYVKRLLPKSARSVDFFGTGFTRRIKTRMLRETKHGRQVRFFDTNLIHDRYIVRDRAHGRMLGTSLGGFGDKIFTMLDLPTEDTKALTIYFDKIRRDLGAS
jgi:hypothetical protein